MNEQETKRLEELSKKENPTNTEKKELEYLKAKSGNNDIELDADGVKKMISDVVKENGQEQAEAIKKELETVARKGVFPGAEEKDAEWHSKNGAVVDTGVFSKSYLRGAGVKNDGTVLAKQLVGSGPFLSLSKNLEDFAKMLKSGFDDNALSSMGVDRKSYNESVKEEYKASGMNETTDADGGVAVPVEFYNVVAQFAIQQSSLLSRVWRIPMGKETLNLPQLAQTTGSPFGGVTFFWKGEGEAYDSSKPTMNELSFTAHKCTGLVYLTDELVADSAINIVNFVVGLFTRAYQYELENKVLSGSGTGQPLGVYNDSSIGLVTRSTANKIKYADLLNMDSEIPEYFPNLTWVMRKATQNSIRGIKDDNNRPIFYDNYAQAMGQRTATRTVMGYPVDITRNASALGSQGDLLIGDFGQYMLPMRQDMTIRSSEHVKFNTDEIAYKFTSRLDGKPAVSSAFAQLDNSTS